MMTILAGPSGKLPDRRAHEVFEDHARARPDAIAIVLGSRQLTYGRGFRYAEQLCGFLRGDASAFLHSQSLARGQASCKGLCHPVFLAICLLQSANAPGPSD
jgi:non-ribosomal peptide synthetase component F